MTMDTREQAVLGTVESQNKKRGFTLTEIAIVLGIIGLILGSIWVAAAAVYTNMRLSKTNTQLLTVVQNVRQMYATSNSVDSTANMAATGTQAAGGAMTYVRAGVFPADMLSSAGNSVSDSWNGYASVISDQDTVADDSFTVQFSNVPAAACINMLVGNTGAGRDPSLKGANAQTTAFTTLANTTLPVTATAAQTACSSPTANFVGFKFRLK